MLRSFQDKLRCIFGPLNKLWALVDAEKEQKPDDETLLDMGQWFKQTILLLSQLFNFFSYHRRENVLSMLTETSVRVNDILKDPFVLIDP